MLQLLTGMLAVDMNRPSEQQHLVEWARPSLLRKRKLATVMDPRLEHNYPLEGAKQSAALILKCLQSEPKSRPTSVEVLEILEQINTFKLKEAETSDIAQHVE